MQDKLNKIVQADCLEYLRELPDGCVDLVLIDPPYEIETKGGRNHFANFKSQYHQELEKISKGISNKVLEELCRVCKVINCYIFCSKKQVPQLLNFFIEKKCHFDILTWHKSNPPPLCGDSYLPDTEYILYFRKSGATLNGSYNTKAKYYISATNSIDKKLYKHPTCKPIKLLCQYIINSSNKNDIILDCFAGSGSTAISSKILGRQFLCCEKDEGYVKIANDRLNNWQEDLLRQKEWLEKRGVNDFFDDIEMPQTEQQETLI